MKGPPPIGNSETRVMRKLSSFPFTLNSFLFPGFNFCASSAGTSK
jgi:hypothetical protein